MTTVAATGSELLLRGALALTERRLVPDAVIRAGIRRLCVERLTSLRDAPDTAAFIASHEAAPVAVDTDAANEQHYEVPAAFFGHVLGPPSQVLQRLLAGGGDEPR